MRSIFSEIYNALFAPRYRYADSHDQMRARVTLLFSMLFLIGTALDLLTLIATAWRADLDFNNRALTAIVIALLYQLAVIGFVHLGGIRVASGLLFLFLMGSTLATVAGGVQSPFTLTLALPLVYASLIWYWPGSLLSTLLVGVMVGIVGVLQVQGRIVSPLLPVERVPLQTLITLSILAVVGLMCAAFANELQHAIRHITRLLIRLRATAEVATQATVTMTDRSELLKRTTYYIRDRFGFYHVQLFLIDPDRKYAVLAASTSDAGDTLLQRGYRLSISSQSTIGQAIVTGEPTIVSIDEAAGLPQHLQELSHDMRSELALPLIVGDQIIGVLDVQSARPGAFSQEDVDSLSTVATHVSVAIHNAQLFEEQRAALNENRRLFLEAELHLREVQRLNQRLTGEAWDDYLKSRNTEAIGFTLVNNNLRQDTAWTPSLQQAASKRRPVVISDGERQIVAVPVELRGRAIGAIEVEMSTAVRQSDALEMLQSVAQRVAMSIDNARLFEQAQELAQQELEVNAISTKIQSVTAMDEIIETAVGELSRALGAHQASIRLGQIPRAARDGSDGSDDSNGSNGSNGKGTPQ